MQLHIITASLVACFWLLSLSPRIPPLRSPLKTDSPTLLYATLLVFTITTYSWLLFSTGTSTLFLDIEDVYSTRADIRANPYHPVLNYMYWWQGSTVNPMIMALGFAIRRPLLVVIGGLLQIELYTLTSLRGFLAGSVFTCGIGFFLLVFKHGRGVMLSWAISVCIVLAVIWYAFDQHAIAALLLLDRWIFNGGQISGCYFEFFSNHEPAHLQHSSIAFLQWLFPGSYDLPIGQIIGRAYFIEFADGEYTNATGHFWADGFACFGYLGMVVATGVGVLYMWIIDSLCRRKNQILVLTSFSMVGMSLTGQSVLTSILTGGIAPYIALLVLVPESQSKTLPDIPRGRLWPA